MAKTHAATFVVTNHNDYNSSFHHDSCLAGGGECTLRAAIHIAGRNGESDRIEFIDYIDEIVTGRKLEISREGDLIIVGNTYQGTERDPVRILGDGGEFNGFEIESTENNLIAGLVLGNFKTAILIFGGDNNTIDGNFIGIDTEGNNLNTTDGSGRWGITIGPFNGTGGEGNTIANNEIAHFVNGPFGTGVRIVGGSATANAVLGNYIHRNRAGIHLSNGANGNTIGAGNVVAGNTSTGILIDEATTTENTVSGNFIGTDQSGTAADGNAFYGIYISESSGNIIADNVISGNTRMGVKIVFDGTKTHIITGNLIGVAADGVSALGNGQDGIQIAQGASGAIIGGAGEALENVIAYNGWSGIKVADDASGVQFLRNQLFSNGLETRFDGIEIPGGGNGGIQPPVNMTIVAIQGADGVAGVVEVSGTAAAGSLIQVFHANDDAADCQPKSFIGEVTADTDGNWSRVIPEDKFIAGDTYLTTTQTVAGSTSKNSSCVLMRDTDEDRDPDSRDCDDGDATVNTGAIDICDDGIDNNCDGAVDGLGIADATCDAVDDDCDGAVDEDYASSVTTCLNGVEEPVLLPPPAPAPTPTTSAGPIEAPTPSAEPIQSEAPGEPAETADDDTAGGETSEPAASPDDSGAPDAADGTETTTPVNETPRQEPEGPRAQGGCSLRVIQ